MMNFELRWRARCSRCAAALAAACALAACRAPAAVPGASPEAKEDKAALARLRANVEQLANTLAPRCGATPTTYVKLEQAALYIQSNFELLLRGASDRSLVTQRYTEAGRTYANVVVEIEGSGATEIVVVGAHYDSYCGGGEPYTPGADDNASGVAVLLELARRFDEMQRAAAGKLRRTLRFVAFTNEEPPYFQNSGMGSLVYAQHCWQKGEQVAAMLSLESLGYFSDEPGSQSYPSGIDRLLNLPDRGDFVAVLGNFASRQLVTDVVESFRRGTPLPVEGLAAPWLPQLGWSDNWAFWRQGYAAVMVTDTALQRNPNYHRAGDTPDTLDYRRMSMAVDGLVPVIADLAGAWKQEPEERSR